MVIINIPDTLTDRLAYSLLFEDFSQFSEHELRRLDRLGNDLRVSKDERDKQRALIYKIIAAGGFECKDSLRDAAFSYDKATKLAFSSGFIRTATRCSIWACALHEYLSSISDESEKEDLEEEIKNYVRPRFKEACFKRKIAIKQGSYAPGKIEFPWFS